MITSDKIKELREQTQVSIMACKKALEESDGDIEKAKIVLQQAGAKIADKKANRELKAGIIESYIHAGGKVGVLVEGRCETDFVAKNEDFKLFLHDVAMHIAASAPEEVEELLEQSFIKNPGITIGDYVKEAIQKFGENIEISRFTLFSA